MLRKIGRWCEFKKSDSSICNLFSLYHEHKIPNKPFVWKVTPINLTFLKIKLFVSDVKDYIENIKPTWDVEVEGGGFVEFFTSLNVIF